MIMIPVDILMPQYFTLKFATACHIQIFSPLQKQKQQNTQFKNTFFGDNIAIFSVKKIQEL